VHRHLDKARPKWKPRADLKRAEERLQELLLQKREQCLCHAECEGLLFCAIYCGECAEQELFYEEDTDNLFEDLDDVEANAVVTTFEKRWKGVGENWNRAGDSRSSYYRNVDNKRKLKKYCFKNSFSH